MITIHHLIKYKNNIINITGTINNNDNETQKYK
jgi:hypothetical protein